MVWRWIALAACGAASLGAVLFVNDGFGLFESQDYLDPEPQIILSAYDPCDKLAFLTLETNLVESPNELRLIAEQVHSKPSGCDFEPDVKVTFQSPSPLLPLGYHLAKDAKELEGEFPYVVRIAKAAQTVETAIFPLGSWNAGFGRLHVKMIATVQTGRCSRAVSQGITKPTSECEFPVTVRVRSPSHKFDVISAIPSTVDVGDDIATIYSWRSRPTTPTNRRPGAIASSELKLASKHHDAIANVTTIIGSSIFGAVVSIWISLLSPPAATLPSGKEDPASAAKPSSNPSTAASPQPFNESTTVPSLAVVESTKGSAQATGQTATDSTTATHGDTIPKTDTTSPTVG
ncbi:hypothetical protein [Ensifer sp. 4252]|uniref:hypothetical protein n=1 Tax=Ensifer sp. 4252 TaxID=3373915 RepID=UPI003D245EFD